MDMRALRPITTLTPREVSVVRLLGSGFSYEQVAAELGISPHTVVTHIKNLYRKLEVHTAAAAVMRAVQLGLLEVALPQ
jgi:DNA-binding CsgD family transcriptional regulator